MKAREVLIYLSVKFQGDWDKIYEFISKRKKVDIDDAGPFVESMNINAVTILDEEYPQQLKRVEKPPFVLFYIGDLSIAEDYTKIVAVIGSRECSKYGIKHTRSIVKGISEELVVVSGMAIGIDSVAQNECLCHNGKTIAVLGSGIDVCYPQSNKHLYEEIKNKGLVISEYPPGVEAIPSNFPKRNRIIAGLSKSLIVTEAYRKSGTMITVYVASTIGVDVCCVPYPAGDESACNFLIKQGAFLVESAKDVLEVTTDKKW